jgi:predicted Zn-dependent protease
MDALSECGFLVAEEMDFFMKRTGFGVGGKRLGLKACVLVLQRLVLLEETSEAFDILGKRLEKF